VREQPLCLSLEGRRLLSADPSVAFVSPAAGASGVSCGAYVSADLQLPMSGIDPSTVDGKTVSLVNNTTGAAVAAIVNTTGAGDAIILTPASSLKPYTTYTFTVTSAVSDSSGDAMTPYKSSFTTGAASPPTDTAVAFKKVALPTARGVLFTDVKVGPDHRVYASAQDGRIFRYPINADGTLGAPQIITSLQDANGGPRLVSGFAFDPACTASNVILWVSNGDYAFTNAPDFTGKVTRMSGPDLQTVQDVLVGLPRSFRDHLNEQPAFGPDHALYFCVGSNSSMGAADTAWGNRSEDLLSAAILRLDTSLVTPGEPINVVTPEGGGIYDPFAPGAPLTIYATGVRNTFDLLWSREGYLYAPNNGSSAGGNAPANGPNVPALHEVSQVEPDFVFKVTAGAYYGHPDPIRSQYVLDGGNPGRTSTYPDAVIAAYPAGTQPDPNYAGYNYDLGLHRSPNGIIEYSGRRVFGGQLNNTLLVAEYSGGDDIVALSRDANGNITGATRAIPGFSGFDNPISLTEDATNGDIYVSEFGGQKLTLLVPVPGSTAASSPSSTSPAATSHAGGSSNTSGSTSNQTPTTAQAPAATAPKPAPPAVSPPPAPTPTPSPAVAASQAVQSSLAQLTGDEAAYKSTLRGYVSARKATIAADEAIIRHDRKLLRTEAQNRTLHAAVQAQIAADTAKLVNDVRAANATLKSAQIIFTRAIRADKARLKTARLNLRHVGTATA
jgi:glucose/arabinose dehydrogenase